MSALRSNYLPASNRRRCVKGRPSYTEPSDLLLSSAINHDQNSDSFSQNEDSYLDSVDIEDNEEEPITIDLSAFLNENPLLAQSAFESASENNVALTESSSQFRVTDCEIKPEVDTCVTAVSPTLDVSISNSEISPIINENSISPLIDNTHPTFNENIKENCLSNDKSPHTINSESVQDITLNGKKTPIKKFSKARPLGLSNPLKKYKNFLKSKDLNKTNEKVFGKYPIVKCEKLDIENFVKNNKIKVSNWPLSNTEVQKSTNFVNNSPIKKRITSNKTAIRPKFMRKPINLNKYLINSNKNTSQNKVNILADHFDVTSKPIVIKANSWKPEVANTPSPVPVFFKNFVKPTNPAPRSLLCKPNLNDKPINRNILSSPETEVERIKSTFITNVNKLFTSPKSYQLIAPKPSVQSPIRPCRPKPTLESIVDPLSDDYTVIEPYVHDPLSPQKPKPILTVPVEVVPPPEKPNVSVNIIVNGNNSDKALKIGKSVFLNGALKQCSSPIKKDAIVIKRDCIRKPDNQENLAKKLITDISVPVKNEESPPKSTSIVQKAKSAIEDAMQSAFLSTQKSKVKSKTVVKKEQCNFVPKDLSLSTTAYSSILNDNLLHGFCDNDFEDVFSFEEDSLMSIPRDLLTPPKESLQNKANTDVENSDEISKIMKKARKRKKYKRKKSSFEDSPDSSETMSASECENEKSLAKKRKLSTLENLLNNKSPLKDYRTDSELEKSVSDSVSSVNMNDSSNLDNKDFVSKNVDSSFSFSSKENIVPELHNNRNSDKLNLSETEKQSEIPKIPTNDVCHVENSASSKKCTNENSNLIKPETCARTLRERKCSSTENDKSSENSVNVSPQKLKIKGSINSKLKIQLKSPRNTSKGKTSRKSCKSEDIIREINTITGTVSKRGSKKLKISSDKDPKNTNRSKTNVKESKTSASGSASFWKLRSSRAFSKRRKPLKIGPKRKTRASCLKVSLNSLTDDVIENANSTSSVSKNNVNLHSSFRKGGKMGTLQKEENSPENSVSISDSNMEVETDVRCSEEHLTPNNEDAVVNPSETSLSLDANSIMNSDVDSKISDSSLLNDEEKDEDKLLSISANEEHKTSSKFEKLKQLDDVKESLMSEESIKAGEKILSGAEEIIASSSIECLQGKTVAISATCVSERNTSGDSIDGISQDMQDLPEKASAELDVENNGVSKVPFVEDDMPKIKGHDLEDSLLANEKNLEAKVESIYKEFTSEDVGNLEETNNSYTSNADIEEHEEEGNREVHHQNPKNSEEGTTSKIPVDKNTSSDSICNNVAVGDLNRAICADKISDSFGENKSVSSNEIFCTSEVQRDREILNESDDSNSIISSILENMCDTISNGDFTDILKELPESFVNAENITIKDSASAEHTNFHLDAREKVVKPECALDKEFHAETVYEEKSFSPPTNCNINKSDLISNIRGKKCPKIKISLKKTAGDSPESLKNWFISESKESEESLAEEISQETQSVNGNATNSKKESSLNPSPARKDSGSVVSDSNSDVDVGNNSQDCLLSDDSSDAASVDRVDDTSLANKTSDKNDCSTSRNNLPDSNDKCTDKMDSSSENLLKKDGISLSHIEKNLSKAKSADKADALPTEGTLVGDSNEILMSKDKAIEKPESFSSYRNPATSSGETSLLETVLSKDSSVEKTDNSSMEENLAMSSSEASQECAEEQSDSLIIKEEPMDFEESFESENISAIESKSIKTELAEGKRKRGRPRKSSTDVKHFENSKNIKVAPVKQDTKITPAPHSSGRKKKKLTAFSTSTPIAAPHGRKKNYDPELVLVPFSKGWSREHVIRATGNDGRKRASDVYYFTPSGNKLRSMPDILNFLAEHKITELTNVNFTFAKELIFREPFEYERDAKQSTKRISVTPKKENADSSANTSLSVDSKRKPARFRSSSVKANKLSSDSKHNSLNNSKNCKSQKQTCLTEFLSKSCDESESKTSRPSRRIVKKVPFDNSFEQFSKKPKSEDTSVSLKSGVKTKTGTAKENKDGESLVIKLPVKSKSDTSKDVVQNSISLSSKGSVSQNFKTQVSKKLRNSEPPLSRSNELVINKSTIDTGNISSELLASRTNIKSPAVHKRLKVKFAARKSELSVLHKPCSHFCLNHAYGLPSVQCSICLCFFHSSCIPFKPAGLTKYACVPCVKTKILAERAETSEEDIEEDIFFPADFDIEILYPSISLETFKDEYFDRTYNVFKLPVKRPIAPQPQAIRLNQPVNTSGLAKTNAYAVHSVVNQNSFNTLPRTTAPRPIASAQYPSPISFNQPNLPPNSRIIQIIRPSVPVQRASNSNNLNVYTSNQGSLPLLQKFSNTYFTQNRPCKKTSQNSPINQQNAVYHVMNSSSPAVMKNAGGSRMPGTIIFHKLPPNYNIRSFSTLSSNTPVLQTLLQQNAQSISHSSKNPPKSFSELKIGSCVSLKSLLPENGMPSNNDSPNLTLIAGQSKPNDSKRKIDGDPENSMKKWKHDSDEVTMNADRDLSSSPNNNLHKTSSLENFSACWNISKFAEIYECLNFIFKFLNVTDLLRASLVCKSWNHLASQKLLWERVCFTGAIIKDWDKCCKALQKYGTKYVDFRGLHNQDSTDSWKSFCKNIKRLNEVEELVFEKVSPFVISEIADSLPQLRKLTCYCLTSVFTEPEIWSTPCTFQLVPLRYLGRLEVLKISSMGGILLKDNHQSLMPYLPNLTHVVLTGFKFNSYLNLECLSQQTQLITLELGDCAGIEPQIYGLLRQLPNLQNLCLQNGGDIDDEKLPEALLNMTRLRTLELMNFQVSHHLPDVLMKLDSLHHFSLWPDNRTKAEQVNFNSYKAATSCTSLKSLCWGILTDDDTVPNCLELKDASDAESEIKILSFEELFQSLVRHYPGVKVELKCLPRSIWSEFCSSRRIT